MGRPCRCPEARGSCLPLLRVVLGRRARRRRSARRGRYGGCGRAVCRHIRIGAGSCWRGRSGRVQHPQGGCPHPEPFRPRLHPAAEGRAPPCRGGQCGCMCRHRRRRCRSCRKEWEGAGMGGLEAMRGPQGAAAGLFRSPSGLGSPCPAARWRPASWPPRRAPRCCRRQALRPPCRGLAPFRGGPSSRGRRPGRGTPTRRRACI